MNYLKTKKIAIIIFLFIISILNLSTYMFSKNILTTTCDFFILLINTSTVTFLLYFLIKLVWQYIKNKNIKIFDDTYNKVNEKKYCLTIWIVQLLCWTPIFLAFYPGILAYDVSYQVSQGSGSYFTHYPLIHTLYLKFFYNILGERLFHNITIGMSFCTITQMMIFSAMLVYVHLFLYRLKISKFIRYIVIIFMSINPLIS